VNHRVVVPPATIGMLGGGQLGRYALMAATALGYRTIVVDPDPSAPAGVVASEHLVAAYDDGPALERLALDCDVVTTEFENPPATALEWLAERVAVAPSAAAVRVAQDRIAEKAFLVENGFPVGPYATLDAEDASPDPRIVDAGAIVKTARLGYDGKGQRRVTGVPAALAAWAELDGVPCVVEAELDLEGEISVLVARTQDGRSVTWPAVENHHVDGILDVSICPVDARVHGRRTPALLDRAEGLALAIADALGYVGVLAVELFVVDGALLVNELAPRPHNSGHWTLDASVTSQFEQQVRAICGVGLGATTLQCGGVAMVNLLGDLWWDGDVRREPAWAAALEHRSAKLHLYGKAVPRLGRKMGHLTVLADDPRTAATTARDLRRALRG
jgi:5-(carboxyamino)imidazole ribonucleotide synthase